jgi:cytochrome P450
LSRGISLIGDRRGAGGMAARIEGLNAYLGLARFLRDPILAMREAHARHGPLIIVSAPLKIGPLRKVIALAAGARFNRDVLSDPAMWRPVHVMYVGRRDRAQRRVGMGIFSITGARHAHYRRLFTPPLRRARIDSLSSDLAQLAEQFVDQWPKGQPLDLWGQVCELVRNLAVALLFADDREHAYPIADLVDERVRFKWTPGALACPYNLPVTPYGRMIRQSQEIERRIMAWAGCKHGRPDPADLMSILANNPEETGEPPSDATVVGHIPSLFVAGYDTCRTALLWTLVLLAQHPRVARQLADELQPLEGVPPTLERVRELPLLDAVIKESLRLLPPVPMQIRIVQEPGMIGDYPLPIFSRVVLSPFVTNRDPGLYPDPDSFRPERWASINPSVFEYSVFSAGPRVCLGQWFGTSLLKVSLATILTRYRVALQADASIAYEVQPTLSPRAAVPAALLPKSAKFAAAPIRGPLTKLIRFPDPAAA